MSLPKLFTIHKFAPPVFRDRLQAQKSISWAIKVNWFRIIDSIGHPTLFDWVLWYVAYCHRRIIRHTLTTATIFTRRARNGGHIGQSGRFVEAQRTLPCMYSELTALSFGLGVDAIGRVDYILSEAPIMYCEKVSVY
jgi:hypothetical protein